MVRYQKIIVHKAQPVRVVLLQCSIWSFRGIKLSRLFRSDWFCRYQLKLGDIMNALVTFCVTLLATLLHSGTGIAPKIFTKGGNLHLRSGENGNIVFEPSQQGKVLVGSNELNMTVSEGPKGDKGDKGNDGINGSKGERGEKGDKGVNGLLGSKGDRGPIGLRGSNGTRGPPGQKGNDGLQGSPGAKGDRGLPGTKGSTGVPGVPGFNGTGGPPGPKGSQGIPGPKGDTGYTSYYTDLNSRNMICNSSNLGVLRYFSTKLQLCTPKGWRYLAFENSEAPCSFPNVPRTNVDAFHAANVGILFQFNNKYSPMLNSLKTFNVTADILPVNSSLAYKNAIMRQAAYFSGQTYLNVSGLPGDFWRTYNWSVMALLKFGPAHKQEIGVLGHGVPSGNEGFHLGISNQQAIHGYYSNDFKLQTPKLDFDKWYHITWTSKKNPVTKSEERCIIIDGKNSTDGVNSNCETITDLYKGNGDTTIGSWWHRTTNNLTLDQLVIVSGIVQYKTPENLQLCYAKLVDSNLP